MSDTQKEIMLPIKNATEMEPLKPTVPFLKLFRFASRKDKFLMTIGGIAAALNGIAMPAFSLIFG